MNEDNLRRINEINGEIKELDKFILNYCMKPRKIESLILQKKYLFGISISGYGLLKSDSIIFPNDLTVKLVALVKKHRDELIYKRDELWGN